MRHLLPFVVLASACSHLASFSDGATVRFEGGRLNGAPVERSSAVVGAHRVTTERAWFVYELDERWSAKGLTRWSNVQAAWVVTVDAPFEATDAFRTTLVEAVGARLARELPGSNCAPAPPDADVSCHWPLPDGTVAQARVQVRATTRGVLVQLATWSTPRGARWTERFLQSASERRASHPVTDLELEAAIASAVKGLAAP